MITKPSQIILRLSIGALCLLGCNLAPPAWAAIHIASGIECNAVNPSQAKKTEWRQEGIVNKSRAEYVWVSCPLTRIAPLEAAAVGAKFAVRVTAFNAEDGELLNAAVRCELKEMLGKDRVDSKVFKASMAPREQKVMQVCNRTPGTWDTSYFIACKLAPKTGISTLTTETLLSGETSVFCN